VEEYFHQGEEGQLIAKIQGFFSFCFALSILGTHSFSNISIFKRAFFDLFQGIMRQIHADAVVRALSCSLLSVSAYF
jgi:hypothetical protein